MNDTCKDDALFESLGKKKKRKKQKVLITVISIVLVLAIVAVAVVGALKKRVQEEFATQKGEVLSYEVTTGSISTVVSGSGNLTDVDLETVTVPEGVEILEISVKENQTVAKGDVLATVEMASVVSTMAQLQEQIKELDDQLSDAEDDAAGTTVYAGVSGRVKVIYGTKDTYVTDVMYENGALALLSLDGYMAVDIKTDGLTLNEKGEVINVLVSQGK